MANFLRQTFVDKSRNMQVGSAYLPDDFKFEGNIIDQWQHDLVPFTTIAKAAAADESIILFSGSRQMFEDYTNPMAKAIIAQDSNTIKGSLKDFMDAESYLAEFAAGLVGNKVEPLKVAHLPSFYGEHLNDFEQLFADYFQSHKIDVNVQIKMLSNFVDAKVMEFRTMIGAKEAYVLAGIDYRGMEFCNEMGGMNGLFGALLKGKQRGKGGFGYTEGAEEIQWGFERSYACIFFPEKRAEAQEAFINFVQSYIPDEALMKQYFALVEQRYQANLMRALQLAGMAQQMQMQANLFAQQTAMNISRQMSSISDGIMDSWNQKLAAESRMSQNFSEAIRGVNTYTDTNGKTFEFSNQADHVYTNQYGDHIGVSGTALDDETVSKLNWTEVHKK